MSAPRSTGFLTRHGGRRNRSSWRVPYRRVVQLQTPLVAWHDLTLLDSQPQWSPAYCPESPRLLLPRSDRLVCEMQGRRIVCDAISPVWLLPDRPYRLQQPVGGQRSLVVVLNELPPHPLRRPSTAMLLTLARLGAAIERGWADDLWAEEQVLLAVQMPPAVNEAQTALQRGGPAVTEAVHRAVDRAREMLASNPGGQQSLAEMARLAFVSPFHLARQFRLHTGRSLHAYRTGLRMAMALERLRQGEPDLSALALDLGYSSQSHFSAVFRRAFGHAPGQVRTNLTARKAAAAQTASCS
jgi:AraC family transcriptional regulator